MKKKLLGMWLIWAAIFCMSGCADTAAETVTEPVTPVTQSNETTQETGAAEEVPEEQEPAEKVWIIGTDEDFKPFEYEDENGNLVGIDVDLLEAIAKDQGFLYDLQDVGWDDSVEALEEGWADAMIAGASITDARIAEGWIFSDGYFDLTQCLAVPSDSGITGFDDLKGKRIGVKSGTMSDDYAQEISEKYGFSLDYYMDSMTMQTAVSEKKIDGCFDDKPVIEYNSHMSGLKIKAVDGTEDGLTECGFVIFDENNRELLDAFNKGLANIKENGTYDEIIKKYLGE